MCVCVVYSLVTPRQKELYLFLLLKSDTYFSSSQKSVP
jgi:hypothetical protein